MRYIQVEKFPPSQEVSFDIKFYRTLVYNKDEPPNVFKVHEEYELSALFNCSGKRIIGNSIGNFSNGDLFLLGPNLPHSILVDDREKSSAICIHFKEDSFGSDFFQKPQNLNILKLLKRAALGCHFYGSRVASIVQEMKQLDALKPFDKMLSFLRILNDLSTTSDYEILSTPGYQPIRGTEEVKRISVIYNYIIENFDKKLSLRNMAALIHVSESTFRRQFKKSMNKNLSEFIIEVRIGNACKLLLESDMNIVEICYLSGYKQITNFNRQFKKLMGVTPGEYRQSQFIK